MNDVDKVCNELGRIYFIQAMSMLGMSLVGLGIYASFEGTLENLGRIDGTLEKLVQFQASQPSNILGESAPETFITGPDGKRYFLEIDGQSIAEYIRSRDLQENPERR